MKIKQIPLIISLLIILLSCTNKKKEKLWYDFRTVNMRDIPISKAKMEKLNDFDIVYQDSATIDNRWNYANCFVLGHYEKSSGEYRSIYIEGFNPFKCYDFIKTISDHYSTDSTYLSDIFYTDTIYIDNKNVSRLKDTLFRISKNEFQSEYKLRNKIFLAGIDRKTNPLKMDNTTSEFLIWGRVIVNLEKGKLKTELVEEYNSDWF